jgi:heavy metal translocating P-type ATPase
VPRPSRIAPSGDAVVGIVAAACLVAGLGLRAVGRTTASDAVLAIGSAAVLLPLTWSVIRSLARGDVGVDGIALVAIAGALILGEYVAASVVAVMLAGGNALEDAAARRARHELTALVERMPRMARRRVGSATEVVPVDAIVPDDAVIVGSGEIVPVDGTVVSAAALLDESTLTGEPLPVTRVRDEDVRSGVANAGDPFELRASRAAADSAYAALVRLVEGAGARKPKFVRIADRYAALFLPLALGMAGVAWAASGDPVRGLAVLVVATPCPLILAAPIALVGGVSRAAALGVIVKGAGIVEQLGATRAVLLDKTGTVTVGTPAVERVIAVGPESGDELLRLAATVDQLSAHGAARALVHEAHARQIELGLPSDVRESPGAGVAGTVDGRTVRVGTASFTHRDGAVAVSEVATDGDQVEVDVDGRLAGVIVLGDRLRPEANDLVERLRANGIRFVGLATGDHQARADAIGRALGVDRVYAEQTPDGKLALVESLRADPDRRPVAMVGDGINDAPALAMADVGIALAGPGATISSETADAVIVSDRVDRIVDAFRIGRRSLAIARQSVIVGLGLSLIAMVVAAFGYLTPVAGAVLQEVIDVAVILNALRARSGPVGR